MINNLKGKGIFVFSDPGGAKPIMALIKLNRLKNYKVFSDREYSFFKDFNLKVEIRKSYFAKEIIKKVIQIIFLQAHLTHQKSN